MVRVTGCAPDVSKTSATALRYEPRSRLVALMKTRGTADMHGLLARLIPVTYPPDPDEDSGHDLTHVMGPIMLCGTGESNQGATVLQAVIVPSS